MGVTVCGQESVNDPVKKIGEGHRLRQRFTMFHLYQFFTAKRIRSDESD
jgi:hypothetical protein